MLEWWGPVVWEYYGGTEGNGLTMCNSAEWLAHKGTVGRSSLAATTGPDGLVYAINGPWGSGKSSAINLVLHHLATPAAAGSIVPTTFNPWWFSGAEALTISFFQELQATVGKSLDEKARS